MIAFLRAFLPLILTFGVMAVVFVLLFTDTTAEVADYPEGFDDGC